MKYKPGDHIFFKYSKHYPLMIDQIKRITKDLPTGPIIVQLTNNTAIYYKTILKYASEFEILLYGLYNNEHLPKIDYDAWSKALKKKSKKQQQKIIG